MPKIAEIEPTPNPNAMKFVLKEPLTWGISRSYGSKRGSGPRARMMRARGIELAGRQIAKLLEEPLRVIPRLAPDRHRHHGCRRLADRAGLALEMDGIHRLIAQLERERQVIPAQRVVTLGPVRRIGQHAPVPRLAVVVEDHLLIELFGVSHRDSSG